MFLGMGEKDAQHNIEEVFEIAIRTERLKNTDA